MTSVFLPSCQRIIDVISLTYHIQGTGSSPLIESLQQKPVKNRRDAFYAPGKKVVTLKDPDRVSKFLRIRTPAPQFRRSPDEILYLDFGHLGLT
jgi:hypothetical protein